MIKQMNQQTQIAINFSQIFQTTNEPLGNNNERDLNQSQPQPNFLWEQSYVIPDQITKNSFENSLTEDTPVIKLKMAPSANHTISNINRLLGEPPNFKMRKSEVDLSRVTERLTSSTKCLRIRCEQTRRPEIKRQNIQKPIPKPLKKNHRRIQSQTKQIQQMFDIFKAPSAFQRLHYMSRINQLKNEYLSSKKCCSSSEKKKNHQPLAKQLNLSKSAYLKNYVPFYQRLQSEVGRSFEKIKMFQNNPLPPLDSQREKFKPLLFPNKYRDFVKSRYMTPINRLDKQQDFADFMKSSINTSNSTIQKNPALINTIEQHFFQKMALIFLKQSQDVVNVTIQTIDLLSKTEFSILQQFIQFLQQNLIKKDQFLDYLRSYYESLSTSSRQLLINHFASIRYKPIPRNQQYMNQSRIQRNKNSIKESQMLQKSNIKYSTLKNSKYSGDYHQIIRNYL